MTLRAFYALFERLKESSCTPAGTAHGLFGSRATIWVQEKPLSMPIAVRISRATKAF